jgi:hypothetical protein
MQHMVYGSAVRNVEVIVDPTFDDFHDNRGSVDGAAGIDPNSMARDPELRNDEVLAGLRGEDGRNAKSVYCKLPADIRRGLAVHCPNLADTGG